MTQINRQRAQWTRELGERLRSEREHQGLSQVDLMKRSGISNGYISQIECGLIGNPGVFTIYALAQALGLVPEFLAWGTHGR